jgi:energy-coupling factor transporter ATP-binding protein EcfA2
MSTIRIQNLTKRYGSVLGVDDLSFEVRPGQVTGFLGPNGSGKATTLRILLGLASPSAGTATIGGLPYHQLPGPARQVGAALDSNTFHPGAQRRSAPADHRHGVGRLWDRHAPGGEPHHHPARCRLIQATVYADGSAAMASIEISRPRGSATLAGAERAGGGSGMKHA